MKKMLICPRQLPAFKQQVHAIRNTLKDYDKARIPTVTKMLDLWANCLGYSNYQLLVRQSKGHERQTGNPVELTPDNLVELSDAVHKGLQGAYSLDLCRWAVAGLFNLDGKKPLDAKDIELIRNVQIRSAPTPLDNRKRRLFELGCITVDTRPVANGAGESSMIVGYGVTELGKNAAGRALEQAEGRSLTHIELAMLGLATDLSRLRVIQSSTTISWGHAAVVNASTAIGWRQPTTIRA